MASAPLNVAVIGLGWWGRIIVPLIKSSAKLRVVRVADPAPAAQAFAAEQGVPLVSFDDVLHDREVQGVVLCTPHTQHTEQIVRAAEAKKHVFCEKPLSLTRADVLRAVDACNRNGVKLAVGHEKRFEPPIMEVFRMAQAGPMTATGIHLLDLSIGLLGPAELVWASCSQLGSQLSNGDTLGVMVRH